MNKKAEFNKVMNALLLEVDKSIVDEIRTIGHEYAQQVSIGFHLWDIGATEDAENDSDIKSYYEAQFDEWESKQEEQ